MPLSLHFARMTVFSLKTDTSPYTAQKCPYF